MVLFLFVFCFLSVKPGDSALAKPPAIPTCLVPKTANHLLTLSQKWCFFATSNGETHPLIVLLMDDLFTAASSVKRISLLLVKTSREKKSKLFSITLKPNLFPGKQWVSWETPSLLSEREMGSSRGGAVVNESD